MRQLGKSKASEYLIARHGVPVSKARLTGDRLAGAQKRLLIVSDHVLPAALKLVAALQIAIDCDRHDIEIMGKVRDGVTLANPRMAGPLLPRQLNYALRNIDCGSVLKFKLAD